MSNGLLPNMKDTYGIEIETDMYDQMFPYMIRVQLEDGTIVASYGATDVHDLIATLAAEIRNHIHAN